MHMHAAVRMFGIIFLKAFLLLFLPFSLVRNTNIYKYIYNMYNSAYLAYKMHINNMWNVSRTNLDQNPTIAATPPLNSTSILDWDSSHSQNHRRMNKL